MFRAYDSIEAYASRQSTPRALLITKHIVLVTRIAVPRTRIVLPYSNWPTTLVRKCLILLTCRYNGIGGRGGLVPELFITLQMRHELGEVSPFKVLSAIVFQTASASFREISLLVGRR
jgi:hypothetical protein